MKKINKRTNGLSNKQNNLSEKLRQSIAAIGDGQALAKQNPLCGQIILEELIEQLQEIFLFMTQIVGNKPKEKPKSGLIDIYIGAEIRKLRESIHLSQEDLAQKTGLSVQKIQDYEHGDKPVGSTRLFDIAKVLGVTVQYFIDRYTEEFERNRREYDRIKLFKDVFNLR